MGLWDTSAFASQRLRGIRSCKNHLRFIAHIVATIMQAWVSR
ncbi:MULTISPECIES: hypothetical protein [Helicobacter]|nr:MULTISPECIES: hypothetical protein [Helicobacter]